MEAIEIKKVDPTIIYGMKKPHPSAIYVPKKDRPLCDTCGKSKNPLREKNRIVGFVCSDCEKIEGAGYFSRSCLKCSRKFVSSGKGNRICYACKEIINQYAPGLAGFCG